MGVFISLLRGVNVGGHNPIRMEALRALYQSLGLQEVSTLLQSGNVVFRSGERNAVKLAGSIGAAIEREFHFRPEVVLRTLPEMQAAIAGNPFAAQADIDPARLLVMFPVSRPEGDAQERVSKLRVGAEKLHLGQELYVYFANGIGRSKLTPAVIEKALGARVTGRNWTTVTKLVALARNTALADRVV